MVNVVIDTAAFENLIRTMASELTGEIAATVVVQGHAEKYWKSCEYGSARGERPWPNPGPRTVDRGGRVFSSQAPRGFVGINATQFTRFLTQEYEARAHGGIPTRQILVDAANAAAEQAANLVRAAAPKDTGELASEIKVKPTA